MWARASRPCVPGPASLLGASCASPHERDARARMGQCRTIAAAFSEASMSVENRVRPGIVRRAPLSPLVQSLHSRDVRSFRIVVFPSILTGCNRFGSTPAQSNAGRKVMLRAAP